MKRYGYFFTAFGAAFVLLGTVDALFKWRLVATSPHVTATVVQYETKMSDGDAVNYPILEYETAAGLVTKGAETKPVVRSVCATHGTPARKSARPRN